MMRIRPLAVTLAAIFALGLASLVHAQQIQDAEETAAVTGSITNIDLKNSTLTVKGPNDDGGTYKVNKDTGIMNGAKKIGLKDLQKGWRVVVNYDTTLKGASDAKLIEVVETTATKP
jgi:Flp pilus assembly protein TadG